MVRRIISSFIFITVTYGFKNVSVVKETKLEIHSIFEIIRNGDIISVSCNRNKFYT
jgi:hypothetical protein